ncbi:hypothetical protein AUC68_11225 [Methyloceanibacter methanicus]|uniref:Uncharacterized protein n=1 Tax=Methyloceanibacter methanicus TaxID=1774968 RepID=A0A1E3VWZ7_9HYPH|nr:hypothetical protein [Methyloceanibacter methanicus]ODR98063.1 hypothetical protein AUC68_11225 [Methyloceanibacter methanicus]
MRTDKKKRARRAPEPVPDGESIRVPLMMCDGFQKSVAMTSPGELYRDAADQRIEDGIKKRQEAYDAMCQRLRDAHKKKPGTATGEPGPARPGATRVADRNLEDGIKKRRDAYDQYCERLRNAHKKPRAA